MFFFIVIKYIDFSFLIYENCFSDLVLIVDFLVYDYVLMG